jgi:DNA modification methylase
MFAYPNNLLNNIVHGNCLELIKNLEDNSIDSLITDPPYGEKMGYVGESGIEEAEQLLTNMLTIAFQKVKQNAHIAVFFTARNLDKAIDAVKKAGFVYRRIAVMYLRVGSMTRPYACFLPRHYPIIIAQKYLGRPESEFHKEFSEMLNKKLLESGLNKSQLSKIMGCDSRLISKWIDYNDSAGRVLVTPRFYPKLKKLFKIEDKWDVLLSREPNSGRKKLWDDQPFFHDVFTVDKMPEDQIAKKHPSPKPLEVIQKLVTGLCKPDGVILDPFSGSGTTALACKNTNRNFIAFEIDETYHKISVERLNRAT